VTTKLFVEMEGYWSDLGLGTELNLAHWMMRFMTDSTFIMIANENVYALANYFNTLPDSNKDTHRLLRKLYPPYRRKSKQLLSDVAWLYEKVSELVKERQKKIENTSPDDLSADMLTMMLTSNTSRKDNISRPMDVDEIRANLYEVIGGGIDTV
ncbi:12934_t:CDS:2, partial [Acaulospora colombiana]